MRFKVGDIITGSGERRYIYINEDVILKVVAVSNKVHRGHFPWDIAVKAISSNIGRSISNLTFPVYSKYFKKVPKLKAILLR